MKITNKSIPKIIKEVPLKNALARESFSKENIKAAFDKTEKEVVEELLLYLLKRNPSTKDYDLINLVEFEDEIETGSYVYYCDVQIGKLFTGGPTSLLKSILKMKDIYIYFIPDSEEE